jgi:hypothetical protein
MGNNIIYEINYIVAWDMALALLKYNNTHQRLCLCRMRISLAVSATVPLKYTVSSERSEISNDECWSFTKLRFIKYEKIMWCFALAGTRKKCSLNFYVTAWFIAEELKQRGPARNLYGDWIILLKEQFS